MRGILEVPHKWCSRPWILSLSRLDVLTAKLLPVETDYTGRHTGRRACFCLLHRLLLVCQRSSLHLSCTGYLFCANLRAPPSFVCQDFVPSLAAPRTYPFLSLFMHHLLSSLAIIPKMSWSLFCRSSFTTFFCLSVVRARLS